MLFREKLLLSNCDSVRNLPYEELRKRVLCGLTFADGVVLAPNALIDNPNISAIFSQRNVLKYLNEEGSGKLVVRGFNIENYHSLLEYYEALPSNFIFSSLPRAPAKSELTPQEQREIVQRLQELGCVLQAVQIRKENVPLQTVALQHAIFARISDNDALGRYFYHDGERELFRLAATNQQVQSRSQWYHFARDYFSTRMEFNHIDAFKCEVIDPAYNSLFAAPNEGFIQDQIKLLQHVPPIILDSGVLFKSLRNELQLIQYGMKVFELISSAGSGQLLRFLTDEAMGYIEDKMTDSGMGYATRKNWFGMYPKLRQWMGVEIK